MGIQRIGGTLVRVTTYTGAAMRKHGGDRMQRKDEVREMLDACASNARTPYTGVLLRRNGQTRKID